MIDLPPLPEPCLTGAIHRTPYYTAEQMRAYAAAAVAAEREAIASTLLLKLPFYEVGRMTTNEWALVCAAFADVADAIRASSAPPKDDQR